MRGACCGASHLAEDLLALEAGDKDEGEEHGAGEEQREPRHAPAPRGAGRPLVRGMP